jgi:hypothetical protein
MTVGKSYALEDNVADGVGVLGESESSSLPMFLGLYFHGVRYFHLWTELSMPIISVMFKNI